MQEIFKAIAALLARAKELRLVVSEAEEPQRSALRDQLYKLEDAIYAMERKAADAYATVPRPDMAKPIAIIPSASCQR